MKTSVAFWALTVISVTFVQLSCAVAEDGRLTKRNGLKGGSLVESRDFDASENANVSIPSSRFDESHRSMFRLGIRANMSTFLKAVFSFSWPNDPPVAAPMPVPLAAPMPEPAPASVPIGIVQLAQQPTKALTPTDLINQSTDRCSCVSCDEGAWETDARGYKCGERIEYLLTVEAHLYPTQNDACARVAGIEYPAECGACNPSTCDGKVPPTPPRESFCGCEDTCTLDVWKSETEDFLSCEAHVMWVQAHDPTNAQERDACQIVADLYPLSFCGQLCNPSTCSANYAPPEDRVCGCRECTDAILDRDTSAFGVTSTCRDRILFLQMENWFEEQACSRVAEEFPDICGPQCDPSRCDGQDGGSVPNPSIVSKPSSIPLNPSNPSNPPNPSIPSTPSIPLNPSIPAVCPGVVTSPEFGGNVWIIDPTMETSLIQGIFDCLFDYQVNNEMGSERYSIFFLPGMYGSVAQPLNVQIGYYTEVAGLGETPLETVINGKIEVYNRCFASDEYNKGVFNPGSAESGALCFALNNFWRTLANLSINIVHSPGTDDCRKTAMFYAISQASSMRRVDIRGGDLSLMDYCTRKCIAPH